MIPVVTIKLGSTIQCPFIFCKEVQSKEFKGVGIFQVECTKCREKFKVRTASKVIG